MSNFSSNQYYPEYKKYLAQYSICIKPVLMAQYERLKQDLPDVSYPIDQYCVAERKKVEEFRNLMKGETHQL